MITSRLHVRFVHKIGHYYLFFSRNNIFFLNPTLCNNLVSTLQRLAVTNQQQKIEIRKNQYPQIFL